MTLPLDEPTPENIARRAGELKVFMLAMNLGVPAMFLPSLPLLTTSLDLADDPPSNDLPVDLMYGKTTAHLVTDSGSARARS